MDSKGSQSITINTSPERVYNLLIDLGNLREISPEFTRAEWLDGLTGPHAGARFMGYGADGAPGVECRVLRAMPGDEWAIKTDLGSESPATWRYELTHDGDACGLTLRWDAPGRDPDAVAKAVAASLQALKQRAEG